MGYNVNHLAPKPEIIEVFDSTNPQFHWWNYPGASWTPDAALPLTIKLISVHWEGGSNPTPSGLTLKQAIAYAASIAQFHHSQRDWEPEIPGMQMSDGIQYHYFIIDGYILQVTPETKRTWNAWSAIGYNLAVCVAAGFGDGSVPNPKNAKRLEALLDWLTSGRPDLPLVQAHPGAVQVHDHSGKLVEMHSLGVLTHDETNKIVTPPQPPKGCCGIYRPVVHAWLARRG